MLAATKTITKRISIVMARIPRRIAGIGASDLPNATAFDAYVGPAREVTADPVRGILTLHDGTTPGGIRVGTKTNFAAPRAPLPSDDETQGYAVGSRWFWQGQEWTRTDGGWQPTERGTFAARAAAEAAFIAPSISRISVRSGDVFLDYVRGGSDLTTADGQGWGEVGTPLNVKQFGAKGDNATDNLTAMLNAVAAAQARGGGRLILPRGQYRIPGDVLLSANNVTLEGEGKTNTILNFQNQGGLKVGCIHDASIGGFTVMNTPAAGVTFGVETGPQAYMAWGRVFDIGTNFTGGDGIIFGNTFMMDVSGLRSINAGGIGINMGAGMKTSMSVRDCHAMDSAGDGWLIKNAVYCDFHSLGSDRADGYGYRLENLHQVKVHGGAEDAALGALRLHHDAATADVVKTFRSVEISLFEKDCNPSHGATGHFAHLTASTGATYCGEVTFRNCGNFNAVPSDNIRITTGRWFVNLPREGNTALDKKVTGGSFSEVALDANTIKHNTAISVTAATAVAKLYPAMRNGVAAFGGRLTVYVTNNTLSEGARSATYELLVSRGVGTSGVQLISSAGNTTGSTADSASFTFSFEPTTNELIATPVGSTMGSFYFHLSCAGNIDAVNL